MGPGAVLAQSIVTGCPASKQVWILTAASGQSLLLGGGVFPPKVSSFICLPAGTIRHDTTRHDDDWTIATHAGPARRNMILHTTQCLFVLSQTTAGLFRGASSSPSS